MVAERAGFKLETHPWWDLMMRKVSHLFTCVLYTARYDGVRHSRSIDLHLAKGEWDSVRVFRMGFPIYKLTLGSCCQRWDRRAGGIVWCRALLGWSRRESPNPAPETVQSTWSETMHWRIRLKLNTIETGKKPFLRDQKLYFLLIFCITSFLLSENLIYYSAKNFVDI